MADYYKWKYYNFTRGIISNPKALLLIVMAGAVVYYFAIHRRR